jgi:histone deacetylase HOS3
MPLSKTEQPKPEPSGSSSRRLVTVFLQDACLQHRYIRSRDATNIVERPERIRAIKIGLAAAIACLKDLFGDRPDAVPSNPDDLADAIARMNIATPASVPSTSMRAAHHLSGFFPVNVVQSTATLDILQHPAVKYIHGDIEGNVYLEQLCNLVKNSAEKVRRGLSPRETC